MKLTETKLTQESNFIVKESKLTNFIVGGIFLLLSLISLYVDPIEIKFHPILFEKSVLMVLIPGIFFTLKGLLSRTLIAINKTGIYQYGKLVTTWNNFVNAYYTQKEITGSYSDNFILIVQYVLNDEYHERTIPLNSTLTKSEEEIIEAINFFLNFYNKD